MWPALALMLAGSVVNHKADQDAYNRQNYFRQKMENYQRTMAAQQQAATEKYLQQETSDARGQQLQDATAARTASLNTGVANAAAMSNRPTLAGNVSSDYLKSEDAAAQRISDRTKRAISQLSTIGAVGDRQVQQGIRFGRAAGQVDATNLASANVGRGYSTDMGNVVPDPMLTLLGKGLTAGGQAALFGGWGGDAGATAGATTASGADIGENAPKYPAYRARLAGLWGS